MRIQAAEMSFLRRVAGHSLRDRGRCSRHVPPGGGLRGRPRTRWRDYVSRLAWERLGVPPPPGRAGGSVWGEGSLGISAQTAASATRSRTKRMKKMKKMKKSPVLSPTYKQRSEDFRKLFKQLPDTERLIVDYSCALQRDILLQGRLYLSENWICFYSNIFRWETLLMVRLKDICSMTKEKTARLIPNAIQLCTDNEKHFLTSFGARDRTYMMMFRLWQNALLEKPLCPKELWHFVHQCYGNELGLTSDDEDYVPPDEDFNTMGYCEELPVEENNENNNDTSHALAKNTEAKSDVSPILPHKAFPNNTPQDLPCTDSSLPLMLASCRQQLDSYKAADKKGPRTESGTTIPETCGKCDLPIVENVSSPLPDIDLMTLPVPENRSSPHSSHTPSSSQDLSDNEDVPTELSNSSETNEEAGEVKAFCEDLSGRQYINGVYKFGVDKMKDLLFTESEFMREFWEQRQFSDVVYHPWRKEQDGNQTREIMYTIALNNPLAPKTATVTETQTLYKASQENECYIIDAEVIAHDVPYHDYFYTLNRYMLTRVAKNKCRLRVSTELCYRKQPWGLVKSFIERNFWSGLDDYFRHLELELNKLEVALVEPYRQSPKTKTLKTGTSQRRKRTLVHHLRIPGNMGKALSPLTMPEDEEEDIHHIKHVAGSTQTRHTPHATDSLGLYKFSKLLLLISLVRQHHVLLPLIYSVTVTCLEFSESFSRKAPFDLTTSPNCRSPLLYSLFTAMTAWPPTAPNTIVKFADDTTVIRPDHWQRFCGCHEHPKAPRLSRGGCVSPLCEDLCRHPEEGSGSRWTHSARFSRGQRRGQTNMSLRELAGSVGVLVPACSGPMKAERSRNKERLEASLAGLCELELLKQRQEGRVLSALCLGDSPGSGRPPWGALRSGRRDPDAADGDVSDELSFTLQTVSPLPNQNAKLKTLLLCDDYSPPSSPLKTVFVASSLQCTPWGIKASLEQQVAQLKVNTEVKAADSLADVEDGRLSSGEVLGEKLNRSHESNYPLVLRSLSATEGTGETETGGTWLSNLMRRAAAVTDVLGEMRNVDPSQEDYQQTQKVETYILGLIQRRALPTRPSKPRTSLAHDTRAVRQSSLCRKEGQHSSKQGPVQEVSTPSQCSEGTVPQACYNHDQECYLGAVFTEDAVPLCHYYHQKSVQHEPGLYHRPRQASMVNTSRSNLPDYPFCKVLQACPDSSNSETDSPQLFHNYPSPLSKPHQPPSPDDQLVNAEYIPAQPCRASTKAYAHHHSSPHKASGISKPNRSTYSPERGHPHQDQQPTASQNQPSRSRGGPKKCRLNEDRCGASRKPGKKTYRSQSENSLQRAPERKYNTVERDGGGSGSGGRGSRSSQSRSKKQQQGGGSYRRWQSTLELSQDEADQPPVQTPNQGSSASNQREHCGRRSRKSRLTHTSYVYPHHHHSHHHQHLEYHLERDPVPLSEPSEDYPHPVHGESESSMSEPDSPDSSSLSSDSDESGGLVWPQQLSPQLSLPSPPAPPGAPLQPKAFVKIKASHALKKKILRFRTGSLKVMTTV
ncbi:hypothetical protein L3Q82_021950 [Scortum barcoo]|uniref:Uncharacterized protein n=1 Tax=Scortum barcoo TaxID=214431 RepID=A0ACB8WZI4_9TELE|nr:hypothetical protein L3Q82_021950 [Scortum barcoo]